jgi:hypothetical protein
MVRGGLLLGPLRAVLRPTLLPIRDADRVERAAELSGIGG